MNALAEFENRLPKAQRAVFRAFHRPVDIQGYLDSIPYKAEVLDRSPLRVMTDGQAHCLDGGLFAALALRRIGFRPLILDLQPDPGMDDDHVLALYQQEGLWGCVAKSNYAGLRFRDPVHRDLHELAITYFEHFFSLKGEKTLRYCTRPLDLTRFDPTGWMWDEAGVKVISKRLYSLKTIPLFPPQSCKHLTPVDDRSYKAGTLGTDMSWVYGAREND
jgi:hypothetical protein